MLFKLTCRVGLLSIRNKINYVRSSAPYVTFKLDRVYAALSNQNYFAKNISLSALYRDSTNDYDKPASNQNNFALLINHDLTKNNNQRKLRKKKAYRPRGYSAEDDKIIVECVKEFGDELETWKKLEIKLGKGYKSIRDYYKFHITKPHIIKGRYSEREDEIILRYVEKNGACWKSWVAITELLGRGSPSSVEKRHGLLVSNNKRHRKKWELFEDEEMLKAVLKIKEVNPTDINSLQNIVPSDFKVVSQKMERSVQSCYGHWSHALFPILKTHLKGVPLTSEWKKDLMAHAIQHKIKHPKELDPSLVVEKVCPGQTIHSVSDYAYKTKNSYKRNESYEGLPMYEMMKTQLKGEGRSCSFVPGKRMEKDLQYKYDIIKIYESLI